MSVLDRLNERGVGTLPGLIGIEVLEAQQGRLASRLELRDELMAPTGYLHAATIVALADRHLLRLRLLREPARWRGWLHHRRAEEQLPRHQARRRHRVRSEARPRRSHDAGLGRHRQRRRRRQAPGPLPLHAVDPLPARGGMIFSLSRTSQTDFRDERDAVQDDPKPHQRPYSHGLAQ